MGSPGVTPGIETQKEQCGAHLMAEVPEGIVISNEPLDRCIAEKRWLNKSEEGEPGHKKQEENPVRH